MKSANSTKHRLNLKALVILLGSVVGFGLAVHVVHGYQVRRNARGLLEQATLAETEGQLGKAAEYLEAYLALEPADTDTLARFGLLLERQAKNPRAKLQPYLVLEQVLRRDGQREDVRRRVVAIANELGRFSDAKAHLDLLLQAAPQDAELLGQLARCEVGQRRYAKAAEAYGKALKVAPSDVRLTVEYAMLLRERLEAPEIADDRIARMVQLNERLPQARLEAARYFKQSGRFDRASEHLQFALKDLGARDADTLLLAAEVAVASRRHPEARQHLDRLRQLHPQDRRATRELARLELIEGNRKQALTHLEEELKSLPTEPEDLWNLANLLVEAQAADRSEVVLKRLEETGAGTAKVLLQARIAMQKGAWREACQLLEKTRAVRLPSVFYAKQLNLLLAQCYEKLSNPDQQLAAYRRALESDPTWLAARTGLASALVVAGKLEDAATAYRRLVDQLPELRPELARVLLRLNLGRLPAERRLEQVEQVLQGMPEALRSAPAAQMLWAEVRAAEGNLVEARELAEGAKRKEPKAVAPWLFLAGLANREGKPDAVEAILQEGERQLGRKVEWALARVGGLSRTDASLLASLETSAGTYDGSDRERLLLALAEAQAERGEYAIAERLWARVAKESPQQLGVRFQLLEAALLAEREAEAVAWLEEIRRLEGPQNGLAAYGEAALLYLKARKGDKSGLAAARIRLAEAAALRPSWSRVPLLEALLEEMEGRRNKALEKYLVALERGEGRVFVLRQTIQLLQEHGRYAEAAALLQRLPEQALKETSIGRLAAQNVLLNAGAATGTDPAAARRHALELARKAVGPGAKDYRDFLWLGQLAILGGELDEAEKALERACELSPQAPEAWVTLVSFLAQTNPSKAEAALTRATAQMPAQQQTLGLAACCEALGRMDQAEALYESALKEKPDDVTVLRNCASFRERKGELTRAEPLLRRLLDPRLQASPEVVVASRRALAVSLASSGGSARFREAADLLDENRKQVGDTTEDRRARGLVLASQPGRRREAIRLLEGISPRELAASPGMQSLLSQLYEAEGDRLRARLHLHAIVTAHPKNPTHVIQYVRLLLRRGETDEAAGWVEKLAAVRPQAFETIELRARVLAKLGKASEAIASLSAYAEQQDAPLDQLALLLEQLGQPAAAEKLYRRNVETSKNSDRVLLLALHLARQRRLAEALSLCAAAWESCPPEQVAQASIMVLRLGGGGTESQQQEVGRLISQAMSRSPETSVLATLHAELQFQSGHATIAIDTYERVLRRDPGNLVALNNLAYLLALENGNGGRALQLINEAIDKLGQVGELLDTRGLVYIRQGQPDLAVRDLQDAIQQAPSPSRYLHLAQAHWAGKNRAAAGDALQKALASGLTAGELPLVERPAFESLSRELLKALRLPGRSSFH